MSEFENDFRLIRYLRKSLRELSTKELSAFTEEDKINLRRWNKAERKLTYQYDFLEFCFEVLKAEEFGDPAHKWGKVHRDLCRFIRRCRNLGKCAFIQLPRHHLKTHICTVFYRIWRFCHDPNLCSLVVSGTLELSKATVSLMKQILANNENVAKWYNEVINQQLWTDRTNKWSETAFNVHRTKSLAQCTIEAVGVGATVTGKHFKELSFDDLVTLENSSTQEQCDKVIRAFKFYHAIVRVERTPGNIPILFVGTPYVDGDLHSSLRSDPEQMKKFLCFIQPIRYADGSLIWSPPVTEEVDAQMRADMGLAIYAAQMMLDPVPEELQEFKKVWIKLYSALPRDLNGNEIHVRKIIIVDPITMKATNSSSRDRGVILCLGVDRGNNVYCLDYKLYNRADESMLFSGIFDMCTAQNCMEVYWESVAYQAQGKINLAEECKRRQLSISVREVKPQHRNKEVRIRALIPFFERGQIYIKSWMIELIQELLRFPKGLTDDIIDTLAYLLDIIKPPRVSTSLPPWIQGRAEQKPYYR